MYDETFEVVPGSSATAWLPMDLYETKAKIAQIHREGTAPETIRAIRADLRYFWSWAELSYGVNRPAYPVPVEVAAGRR